MLKVHTVPAFRDNYIWLIQAENSNKVIIVDPGDALAVLDFTQQHNLIPAAIFITHHHVDHISGVKSLREHFDVPVYGPRAECIFWVTHSIDSPSIINLGNGFPEFSVIDTPGHTAGHISFYIKHQLFCGDTLFAGGCGRLLGGSAEQLFASLQQLKQLPEETLIYCTHEYTQSNLKFALKVEPENTALKTRINKVNEIRLAQHPSLPSRLGEELATNPFLRTNHPSIKKAAEQYSGRLLEDKLAVFTALRSWKDND